MYFYASAERFGFLYIYIYIYIYMYVFFFIFFINICKYIIYTCAINIYILVPILFSYGLSQILNVVPCAIQ